KGTAQHLARGSGITADGLGDEGPSGVLAALFRELSTPCLGHDAAGLQAKRPAFDQLLGTFATRSSGDWLPMWCAHGPIFFTPLPNRNVVRAIWHEYRKDFFARSPVSAT